MRPHGLQPTRLLRPWDFPGQSTGVGCHCLLRNNIIGLMYLLYFFYYTFRQIHNNYVMSKLKHVFPSVQFSSVVFDSATPWTAARQASLSITNSRSLLKLISIRSVMPSTISSPIVPLSCRLQSFPESGSFQMSQLFKSGGQSIRASASASVPQINIQD